MFIALESRMVLGRAEPQTGWMDYRAPSGGRLAERREEGRRKEKRTLEVKERTFSGVTVLKSMPGNQPVFLLG